MACLLSRHGALMSQLGPALAAFYNATVELGVADQVTTFTASEFGRTLTSNGDGSDHGWGSHHLVPGGAGLFARRPRWIQRQLSHVTAEHRSRN